MDINGKTRVFGVIADPVFQLRTPEFINPIFEQRHVNIVAVPFHISATDLENAWTSLRTMQNLVGLGVAMPHKGPASRLCDALGTGAQRLGVVSAIRHEPDGSFVGDALDGMGFLNGLRKSGKRLRRKRILLVGAGGAGRSVAFALLDDEVASLTIANRSHEKAVDLAHAVNQFAEREVASAGVPNADGYDVVINTTSLGLNAQDPLPLDVSSLSTQQLVIDLVAQPEETQLLRAAKERGCETHSGLATIRSHMALIADFVLRGNSTK